MKRSDVLDLLVMAAGVLTAAVLGLIILAAQVGLIVTVTVFFLHLLGVL